METTTRRRVQSSWNTFRATSRLWNIVEHSGTGESWNSSKHIPMTTWRPTKMLLASASYNDGCLKFLRIHSRTWRQIREGRGIRWEFHGAEKRLEHADPITHFRHHLIAADQREWRQWRGQSGGISAADRHIAKKAPLNPIGIYAKGRKTPDLTYYVIWPIWCVSRGQFTQQIHSSFAFL